MYSSKSDLATFSKNSSNDISTVSLYSFIAFRMWDLIVSVPDHCLSFYFSEALSISFCTFQIPLQVDIEALFLEMEAMEIQTYIFVFPSFYKFLSVYVFASSQNWQFHHYQYYM